MTLREYITHWQETYDKPRSRPTTYAAHDYIIKNHILPGLGDIRLSDLTESQIGTFLEERKRFGSHRSESPDYPGLSENTIRHIHRLLQQCLDQAIRDEQIETNPAKAFHYPKPKKVNANVLTPLEMEDYLDAAERRGYLPMFLLALTAGLRQGELIALKWSDLDTKQRTLTISEKRAVERRELMEYGEETRTVILTKEAVSLLAEEHAKHPSSPLMFMHPATLKPYSPQMVRRMHKEIITEAGLDHIRFTDLRHTCAVLSLQNGMGTKELAQMLGHARSNMLDKAMAELENYTGNVWTHIISLKREDAARLGYDNAAAWRNLIRSRRNDIAAAMKIPPADFRWYAAFHDEGEHPHIHMMAWSAKPGQAYRSKEGIRQIKSKLTNDIFRNEMLHLYEQKSESRNELVRQARKSLMELVQAMRQGLCNHPDAEQLMLELAAQLDTVKGKKSYGYLPKRLKNLVNEIVDEMERLPIVSDCYQRWMEVQGKVDGYYHDNPRERLPLSQQKEFTQIKNAIIQEAERLRLDEVTFEEQDLSEHDEPEEFQNESYDYWTLRDVIRDESQTLDERGYAVEEMEKLAENGDMYAQYLMGKLWRDGPLLIPDGVNARYWFERAAEQGHLVAQYALAKLCLSDDLEVRNVRQGMNWLYTAATNGDPYAMYRLAKECLKGENIERDTASAVEWFTASAERGNQYAQYMLGKLYLTGNEVPHDEERAVYWLTESADQDNPYAQFLLDHLEENRPPSVMLAVTRLHHHMGRIFRDNSVPKSRPGGIQIDRKRLKKLQEKRIALGHKPDDHEEQWPDMTM